MSVLGSAIAHHLLKLSGLYSVELPLELESEMLELVRTCSDNSQRRAVLVTDSAPTAAISSTPWAEILRWRTDDDRIFVWARGRREPDSSFRSAVKPFISSRFPADQSGGCTLDALAELSIDELWLRRGYASIGAPMEAFRSTAKWVAGVLREAFEQAGSTPSTHWSDRFLVHWANAISQLDSGLERLARPLEPRHAWELVRVAGLPAPASRLGGNPFLDAPRPLEESEWPAFAKNWTKVVDEEIRPEGKVAALLAALDRVAGAAGVSPWRGLAWSEVQALAPETAAPEVGAAVFVSGDLPSMLDSASWRIPPTVPAAWWGVTESTITEAMRRARGEISFRRADDSTGLVQLADLTPSAYWLATLSGQTALQSTARRWTAKVAVPGIRLVYREGWQQLWLSPVEPGGAQDGDAWIDPGAISLTMRGCEFERLQATVRGDGGLAIDCEVVVAYTAVVSSDDADLITGSWDALRPLRLRAKVRLLGDGEWGPARDIAPTINVLVPSPFSPTIAVRQDNKLAVVPDGGDEFRANTGALSAWQDAATPDLLLEEEGNFAVQVYDGTLSPQGGFSPSRQIALGDVPLPNLALGIYGGEFNLDERDVFTATRMTVSTDVAVVKVQDRAANFSSGLLSAVTRRPAGRRQPSTQARDDTLLGQYQGQVVRAIAALGLGQAPDSLFQCVVSTASSAADWPPSLDNAQVDLPSNFPAGFALPGVGNGPSDALRGTPQWSTFMSVLASICRELGLGPDASELWLSGLDPSVLDASLVQEYLAAHRELVLAARSLSGPDVFWSSYPLSILVVDGRPGDALGQLLAVLLSPLHPARLAWAFSVAVTARIGKVEPALLGFAEGWNIPYTGGALNTAGQAITLVAVPTDPGPEQDFVAWSALAVLSHTGHAELPVMAAGLPLPWGGRTGINQKVVERAIVDYLATHPYLNALEVDLRSVNETPRSQEIDEAVLRYAGTNTLNEVEQLDGGTRVWDSEQRRGSPPSRDALLRLRGQQSSTTEYSRPFEWRRYQPGQVPTSADVAFIENANVNLAVVPGSANGVMGALPIRRFCPPVLQGRILDQQYSVTPGDDLLGLASLLAEIEVVLPGSGALRSTPLANSLGIGIGARWEVLGTFNLDPLLLSTLVVEEGRGLANNRRLLWEWRPSWLGNRRRDQDALVGRPYYVVARIPASLVEALRRRQSLTESQTGAILTELGSRGIGLASLYAKGGTHESEAAGLFYALRTLLPPATHRLPAAWLDSDGALTTVGLLPVDPVYEILAQLAQVAAGQRRSDLLAVRISQSEDRLVRVCLVPVEVKHHGNQREPAPLPPNGDQELSRAREQLEQTAELVKGVGRSLHPNAAGASEAVATYARRVGFAMLVDLAVAFGQISLSAEVRGEILRGVLDGRVRVTVGKPVLLWFAPGTSGGGGQACIVDLHGPRRTNREVFIDPVALPGMWWDDEVPGANEELARRDIDSVMIDAFAECSPENDDGTTAEIRDDLARVLGLSLAHSDSQGGDETEMSLGPVPLTDTRPLLESSTPQQGTNHADAAVGVASPQREPSLEESPLEVGQVPAIDVEARAHIGRPRDVVAELSDSNNPVMPLPLQVPQAFVGWTEPTSRWALVGKVVGTERPVGLDYDHPKAIGIFGYMGSGKSYLLGALVEAALTPIPGINNLPAPLAAVIFNYRRNASDRFELSSLARPNHNPADLDRLASEYSASPQGLSDVHILRLPGRIEPHQAQDYDGLSVSELFFDPSTLTVEDWELLMGEPGSGALFARTIRLALGELRATGDITLDKLEEQTTSMLTNRQSRDAARLRFRFVERYLSQERGLQFEQLIRPGRAVVVDLRDPLFTREDALRFFLVCANYVSRVQGRFNKLVVFDEAHEYMSAEFGERIESRIRQMRHEGTSYIFATQDVESVPTNIRRFISTKFVFGLGSRQNVDDMVRFVPELRNHQLLGMATGRCLLQANQSVGGFFERPREIHVRPRVTEHGGASRIFSREALSE